MKKFISLFTIAFLFLWIGTCWAATVKFGDNTGPPADDFSGTTEDAQIKRNKPTFNYGGKTIFNIGEPASTDNTLRSLIRFTDIATSIGVGATITNADLYLYCSAEIDTSNRIISAHRVLLDWGEGDNNNTLADAGECAWNYYASANTWNTAGCAATLAEGCSGVQGGDADDEDGANDRCTASEDNFGLTGVGSWDLDLTIATQNWYSGNWSEYGIFLISSGEGTANSAKTFEAKEGTDGQRPYLEVTYTIAGGGPQVIIIY